MKRESGHTLLEMIFVTLLMGVLVVAMLGLLVHSDTYWNQGQGKITEQQEARFALDAVTRELTQSNPYWGVTIGTNSILFYKPEFDAAGYRTGIHWIGFRLHPLNEHLLVKRESGDVDYTPVANHVESITFAGSTDGCVTFDSASVPVSCPQVRVTVVTHKDRDFQLTSDVVLRNQILSAPGEPPEEGEF
ncbi:MAG: type II secretion system protein [Candidatus Omnitrophica bacterium]|nr:type II secretion system protein [Candidatus Omnitrophota bacterium]